MELISNSYTFTDAITCLSITIAQVYPLANQKGKLVPIQVRRLIRIEKAGLAKKIIY